MSLIFMIFSVAIYCIFEQVHPEGKFVVDLDKNIDINDVKANSRVALRNDSYALHKILPSKVRVAF